MRCLQVGPTLYKLYVSNVKFPYGAKMSVLLHQMSSDTMPTSHMFAPVDPHLPTGRDAGPR